MADACKGKSNKIAIVQGALSAAASAYTLKGVENVLAKHPERIVEEASSFVVVEKRGPAAQAAIRLDPRRRLVSVPPPAEASTGDDPHR